MVGFMIANVGFGPLAAYLLNLEALFNFTPGLVRNAEIEAGMFEIVLGALERRSEQGLIMSVVAWGLLTIFIIEVLQQRDAACHGRLTGHSVETFIKDMLGPRLTRPGRQSLWETMTELPGWNHFHQWRCCLSGYVLSPKDRCLPR